MINHALRSTFWAICIPLRDSLNLLMRVEIFDRSCRCADRGEHGAAVVAALGRPWQSSRRLPPPPVLLPIMFYGITDLFTFILGTVFIVLLPGPNSLYVMAAASRWGVRAGRWSLRWRRRPGICMWRWR